MFRDIAARLYHWMRENNVDPDKIKLVFVPEDAATEAALKFHINKELSELSFAEKPVLFSELQNLKLNGLAMYFSNTKASAE